MNIKLTFSRIKFFRRNKQINTTNFNNNIQLKKNIFISKTKIQKIKNPIKRTKSLPELTLEEIHEKKKSRFPF